MLVVVALAFAAAAAAGPGLAVWALERGGFRGRVAEAGRRSLGRPLAYAALGAGRLPPRLVLERPYLEDAPGRDWAGAPVRAERAVLELALPALLRGELRFDPIAVEGLALRPAGAGGPLLGDLVAGARRQGESSYAWTASGGDAVLGARGVLGADGRLSAELRLDRLPAGRLAPLLRSLLPDALGDLAALEGSLSGSVELRREEPDGWPALSAEVDLAEGFVRREGLALRGPVRLRLAGAETAGTGPAWPGARFAIDATDAALDYAGAYRKPAGASATVSGRLVSSAQGGLAVEDLHVEIRQR